MTLVNDFKIGADPEFVFVTPDADLRLTPARGPIDEPMLYGLDHGGWVIEPHPIPDFSAKQVTRNIKVALNQIARVYGENEKWRAGAFLRANQRNVTLGGHVHIDQPRSVGTTVRAYDRFTSFLTRLDILPTRESDERRVNGGHLYGQLGDVRHEHGHYEYRSMCSWLFSQKTTMLCLTGIKLITAAPDTLPPAATLTGVRDLVKWLEGFKGQDDDVDWILDHDYFGKSMEARPDRDIKSVWKVEATNKNGLPAFQPPDQVQNPVRQAQERLLQAARDARDARQAQIEQQQLNMQANAQAMLAEQRLRANAAWQNLVGLDPAEDYM